MRILFLMVFAMLATEPAASQTVLKREPLILPAYVSALVDNGKCGMGRVMKVTGTIPGRARKRMCVLMGVEQATRGNIL